jgi:hypothetical protein
VVAASARGRPRKAEGPSHRSLAPIPVRYASVDPATQRPTARQGDTPRDREQTARLRENSQLTGRFLRWWQVSGSNQRRLNRRFRSWGALNSPQSRSGRARRKTCVAVVVDGRTRRYRSPPLGGGGAFAFALRPRILATDVELVREGQDDRLARVGDRRSEALGVRLALGPELAAGGLARRPYDLRHTALSLWLISGGDPAQIAARAGNSVAVLLTVYSHCIHGRDDLLNQQISRVLGPPAAPGPCPSVESQR